MYVLKLFIKFHASEYRKKGNSWRGRVCSNGLDKVCKKVAQREAGPKEFMLRFKFFCYTTIPLARKSMFFYKLLYIFLITVYITSLASYRDSAQVIPVSI